ncbi:hypothetical protein [Streptomyces sp. RP5T]|nr:hypothetical protein [Streptomyces sp. RP5T]
MVTAEEIYKVPSKACEFRQALVCLVVLFVLTGNLGEDRRGQQLDV